MRNSGFRHHARRSPGGERNARYSRGSQNIGAAGEYPHPRTTAWTLSAHAGSRAGDGLRLRRETTPSAPPGRIVPSHARTCTLGLEVTLFGVLACLLMVVPLAH